jgi:hypothetical protein
MLSANEERLRAILLGQEQVMREVHGILAQEQERDDLLRAAVLSSKGVRPNRIARLDPDRVYHEQAIRSICIRYRLRFLDGGRYKGAIPGGAIMELRRLEARSEGPLRGFKIMAPAARFRLCDKDADPLLFVAVGPSHYYLVHKWGRDLRPLRALAVLPLRSALHGSFTLLAFALLVAALLPNTAVGAAASAPWWGGHRLLAALWTVMLTAGFASFAWFAFFGKFSDRAWNDPNLN